MHSHERLPVKPCVYIYVYYTLASTCAKYYVISFYSFRDFLGKCRVAPFLAHVRGIIVSIKRVYFSAQKTQVTRLQ